MPFRIFKVIVPSRVFLTALVCTKFVFGWGFVRDPAGASLQPSPRVQTGPSSAGLGLPISLDAYLVSDCRTFLATPLLVSVLQHGGVQGRLKMRDVKVGRNENATVSVGVQVSFT